MNDKVSELVDDLAQYLDNTSDASWEDMPETSEDVRSKEDCRKYSVAVLKNLARKYDLALIDRGKLEECIHYVEDAMGGKKVITTDEYVRCLPIIPLAEALEKE